MKYRILKETPFHNAGDVIDSIEYINYYNKSTGRNIDWEDKKKSFFQPIRYEKLPLDFIWNYTIYTKGMDGIYRTYVDLTYYLNGDVSKAIKCIEPNKLLDKVNNTSTPVFEIRRYEQ